LTDLTVIMLTLNKLPEHWVAYHRGVLQEAIGDSQIITISKTPMDLGRNYLQDSEGIDNIYRQMLRGAQLAETTYVAYAEDDTLYHESHFAFMPEVYAYNFHRFDLHVWGTPVYYHHPSIANCTLIANRDFVIDHLGRRYRQYPNGIGESRAEIGGRAERKRDLPCIKYETFYSQYAVIGLKHPFALERLQQKRRKDRHPVEAFDIPYWGHARHVADRFKREAD
jgi:hypothetical protein